MNYRALIQDIRLSHYLKNKPVDVKRTGIRRWSYNPCEDEGFMAYNKSQDRIEEFYPMIFKLLKKLKWI